MNKPNMTCRVCGKEYYCCGDSRKSNAWKSMACSQECFKEYMKRIEESRKPVVASEDFSTTTVPKIQNSKDNKYSKRKNVENVKIKEQQVSAI